MSRRAALVFSLAALLGGCRRGDSLSDRVAQMAIDCGSAAETYFVLRAGAGDYSRKEADERTRSTEDGLKKCAAGNPRSTCCEQARLVRARIGGGGFVAICDTFFRALKDDGCTNVE